MGLDVCCTGSCDCSSCESCCSESCDSSLRELSICVKCSSRAELIEEDIEWSDILQGSYPGDLVLVPCKICCSERRMTAIFSPTSFRSAQAVLLSLQKIPIHLYLC